jgi:hypothetical protein
MLAKIFSLLFVGSFAQFRNITLSERDKGMQYTARMNFNGVFLDMNIDINSAVISLVDSTCQSCIGYGMDTSFDTSLSTSY